MNLTQNLTSNSTIASVLNAMALPAANLSSSPAAESPGGWVLTGLLAFVLSSLLLIAAYFGARALYLRYSTRKRSYLQLRADLFECEAAKREGQEKLLTMERELADKSRLYEQAVDSFEKFLGELVAKNEHLLAGLSEHKQLSDELQTLQAAVEKVSKDIAFFRAELRQVSDLPRQIVPALNKLRASIEESQFSSPSEEEEGDNDEL